MNEKPMLSKMELYPIPDGTNRLNIPISFVTGAKSNKIERLGKFSDAIDLMRFDEDVKAFGKRLRKLREDDKIEYDKTKTSKCPGFIVGKYRERKDSSCEVYVPLIGFDVDKFEDELTARAYLEKCKENPYVFTAFLSPSMRGLRIFIWCDSTSNTHKVYYKQVTVYLSEILKIPTDKAISQYLKRKGKSREEIKAHLEVTRHIDTSTSNISRIWFYTHVPTESQYINIDSTVFKLLPKKLREESSKDPDKRNVISLTWIEKIEAIELIVEDRYKGGSRNERLFMLACIMFEHGLSKTVILDYCKRYEENGFDLWEIITTINSAEKRSDHGKYTDENLFNYIKILNENNTKKTDDSEEFEDKGNEVEEKTAKSKFTRIKEKLFDKYNFRLNIISNELEYKVKKTKKWVILNENDLIVELLECNFNGVETVLMALLKSSYIPKHNPIVDYFKSLPVWDESQPDYIEQLASYVDAKDQDWFNLQFKKMLVRSVACAMNLIPFNKHCFTLQGKQNDGKTSFLRFLCPPSLKDYFKENVDVQSKDGRLALSQNLFINLDELATFSKYDINKIKAWMTIDKTKERLPYDRKNSIFPRRASFLASTNLIEILNDNTGNVRWLIFEINHICHDNGGAKGYNKNVNIDKVYSQAYALLNSGFNFKLTQEELAKSENNNRKFQVVSLVEELIQERFMPGEKGKEGCEFFTTTSLYRELEKITQYRIKVETLGRALVKLGFEQDQKFFKERGYQLKGYYVTRILKNDEPY